MQKVSSHSACKEMAVKWVLNGAVSLLETVVAMILEMGGPKPVSISDQDRENLEC